MKQDTQSKFAAILAAAQSKVNEQATPKFNEPGNPQPVKDKPELSGYTIEDILTGCEPAEDQPEQTEQPKPSLKIVDYSERAFAIVTETKPPEDILNVLRQYGNYNSRLKCGKGWIFSKRHLNEVKAKLSL